MGDVEVWVKPNINAADPRMVWSVSMSSEPGEWVNMREQSHMPFKMVKECPNSVEVTVLIGSDMHYYCKEHGSGQDMFPWVASVTPYRGKERVCEQKNFTVPIEDERSKRQSPQSS